MKGQCWRTSMMKGIFGLILALAAGAHDVAAQQRAGAGFARGGANLGVETVIRLADELELSGAQRDQLESIRVELLEMRTSQAARQMALLSEIQAGIREREAARQEFAGFVEIARETLGGARERMQEILTEEQRDELRQLNRRATRGNQRSWRSRGARDGLGSWDGRGARDGRGAWRGRGGPDGERLERARGSRGRGDAGRGRGGRGDQPAWTSRGG